MGVPGTCAAVICMGSHVISVHGLVHMDSPICRGNTQVSTSRDLFVHNSFHFFSLFYERPLNKRHTLFILKGPGLDCSHGHGAGQRVNQLWTGLKRRCVLQCPMFSPDLILHVKISKHIHLTSRSVCFHFSKWQDCTYAKQVFKIFFLCDVISKCNINYYYIVYIHYLLVI